MRQLSQTDLWRYATPEPQKGNVGFTAKQRLSQGIGVISTTTHLKEEFSAIKSRTKGTKPLLNHVVAMCEKTDAVIPFSFGEYAAGALVPKQFPFLPYTIDGKMHMYVNFSDFGKWSKDKTYFEMTNGEEDMYALLESGVVGYAMTYTDTQKICTNNTVVEAASRLYSLMFMTAFRHKNFIALTIPDDFTADVAAFCAAKFFIKYVAEYNGNEEMVNQMAYKATNPRSSMVAITEREELSGIDYTSLSGFLLTLRREVYGIDFKEGNNSDILTILQNMMSAWYRLFDERTMFMLEYFPYFVHFAIGMLHRRISISSLYSRYQLLAPAAGKMYTAIVGLI